MPADGDRSSDLLLGRPIVTEYDVANGGWRLVADAKIELEKTLQRAAINISGSVAAEYELVAAIADQQIRVMEVMLTSSSAQNIRFQSGWTGTAITGPLHLANAGEGIYAGSPDSPELYHFETESGDVLVLDTDAGGQIGGWLIYYAE
jgi:hypothetical protein